MAKKNSIGPLYLFAGGTLLLSLAWLMPSFPLVIFVGLSPFIAIAVNNRKEKTMWTSLELVLAGLSISLFASSFFDLPQLTFAIVQAILFTLPFVGYTFVRKSLGPGVSIITLPLFWLALEYVLLKWYPFPITFLADSLMLKSNWTAWNGQTGYLGASLWILTCNVLLFQGLLTEKKVNWLFIVLFLLTLLGPIAYSAMTDSNGISRDSMMALYTAGESTANPEYTSRGEFIPRTAAWISVLIVLFTFVKRKTSRK